MSDKIKPHHLARKAILYVRQSSAHQVLHSRESQALQYAMRDRLVALGWSEVDTVDDDLGRSAAGGVMRVGFERMVAEVCLGKVGAVCAREDLPVEYSNLFAECLPCGQQRLNDRQEGAIACRGFAHAGANRPEAPRAITSPKVFMSPRMTLAVACRWLMRCVRATSSIRSACASMLFTATSRNQPVRTICASPQASLASVLTCSLRAALACRASTQTTGSPSSHKVRVSQFDNWPVSRPISLALGAWRRSTPAIGRIGWAAAAPDCGACAVHHADRGCFQRDIEAGIDILGDHGGSPRLS